MRIFHRYKVGGLLKLTGPVSKSLPLLLRRAMYNLRGGFLIRPLAIALGLGGAEALLTWTEEEYPALSSARSHRFPPYPHLTN